ncbi:flagellar export protein FliJ [Clostridium ganghwense]|uniref:Flagellar FliJ protein n=1 Tax=Clostridium ganghwense TaxID=312089 RepID=A0ABT4CMV0_9CLOT|nr:flagellar export protein FliJ [Clostridium ganghwense]MCY6370388.1 flagellar export protein FliJ [Clostridium ganghwense]
MAGFKFRMQKVLDIRLDKEEESKRIFKKAQDEKNKAEQKLNDFKNKYNKYSKIDTNCSMIEKKIRQNYCNALYFNIGEITTELENKVKILDKKREELKQKQIERKTVEILRDKQRDAYIKEQKLIEQKNNDEFALYAYIRNTKNQQL